MRTPVLINQLVSDNALPNHTRFLIDPSNHNHKQTSKSGSNLDYADSFQTKKKTTNITKNVVTTTTTDVIDIKKTLMSPRKPRTNTFNAENQFVGDLQPLKRSNNHTSSRKSVSLSFLFRF